MTTYTPTDNTTKTITIIDDGEKGKSLVLNRPIKDVADRVQGLKKTFEHLATPGSTTPGRSALDGITRIRSLAGPPSVLTNLSVGASNDKEIFFVENHGLYVYLHASASGVDGTFRVTHASGRFHWIGNDLRGTSPGLPHIDSAGRLLGPTEIANTVVKTDHKSAGQSDVAEAAAIGSNASATFADCTSDAIYAINGIKTGDELTFSFNFSADCEDATADSSVAIVGLFAGQSGAFTELSRVLVRVSFDSVPARIKNRRGYTLTGTYVAVSAADVVVKLRSRVGSTTNTPTAKVFRPCACTTQVKRP